VKDYSRYNVTYFGDLDEKGFRISYMLLEHKIMHEFVLYPDDDIVVIKGFKEIKGYETISEWLTSFRYIIDLNRR
jgi:hypothetical protein